MSRGEARLEIARRLLSLPVDEDVMQKIREMPLNDREHLRCLTDWVEEYEKHESH